MSDSLGARVLSAAIEKYLSDAHYPVVRDTPLMITVKGNHIDYIVTVATTVDLSTHDDSVVTRNPLVGDSVLAAGDALINGFVETAKKERKEDDDGTFAEERQMAIGVASYFRPRSRTHGGTRRGRLKS